MINDVCLDKRLVDFHVFTFYEELIQCLQKSLEVFPLTVVGFGSSLNSF